MQNVMTLPGEQLKTEKMPGHWVLACLGKRVLRPGGMQLTRRLLNALQTISTDKVVEFAPGLGLTARITLARNPASYIAIERDEAAARIVASCFRNDRQRVIVGSATDTGLPAESATVVYGEAMMTMHPAETKRAIIREASGC